MQFDHERLDVYRVSLDFLVHADEVIRTLPRGRAYFCDQLGRAALSMVLNLTEGAGKVSAGDKRRYYLTARGVSHGGGSATRRTGARRAPRGDGAAFEHISAHSNRP